MSDPVIPSPMPPYSRANLTTRPQTLTDDGDVSVAVLTTYLSAAADKTAVLPDGSVKQQRKNIFIPASMLATTGTWTVTGEFAGFTSLKFNKLANSVQLEWDGTAWFVVGGNAEQIL